MFSPGTAEDQCNRWDTHLILSKEFTEMFFLHRCFRGGLFAGIYLQTCFCRIFLYRYYAAIFLQRCFSTHVCQFSSTKCIYIEVSNMSITSRACTNAVPCWDCPPPRSSVAIASLVSFQGWFGLIWSWPTPLISSNHTALEKLFPNLFSKWSGHSQTSCTIVLPKI